MKEKIAAIIGEEIFFQQTDNQRITSTQVIKTSSGKLFFLKSGAKNRTFRCEANGLKELHKSNSVTCPKVIAVDDNYLLTEYIQSGVPSALFFEQFGKSLSQLHRFEAKSFGFYEDNFIGANKQINTPTEQEKNNWTEFYFNKRLLFQFKLAEQNDLSSNYLQEGFVKLEKQIHKILSDGENTPCLLHGDLWSGNFLCNRQGKAVIIDPAVYYGNREADLAMTKLFGGFPNAFYSAYQQAFPLPEGWKYRENIYKLYHVLNHLNLFGKSYLAEAEKLVKSYI